MFCDVCEYVIVCQLYYIGGFMEMVNITITDFDIIVLVLQHALKIKIIWWLVKCWYFFII